MNPHNFFDHLYRIQLQADYNNTTFIPLNSPFICKEREREFYGALFNHFFKVTCPAFSTAPLINSRSTAHLCFTNSFATLKEEATIAINTLVATSSSNA